MSDATGPTPEERAEALVACIDAAGWCAASAADAPRLGARLAEEIRAAVLAERRRCVGVANAFAGDFASSPCCAVAVERTLERLVEALDSPGADP